MNKTMQEIDAWLAENVMRWKLHPRIPGWWKTKPADASPVGAYRNDWHPTTNIAQAFEVVEIMNNCLHLKEHGAEGEWCAMFCVSMLHYEHGETASLAICLAAQKAWEAK